MDNMKKALIGGGLVLLVALASVVMWWSSQTDPGQVDIARVGGINDQLRPQGTGGLVRAPGEDGGPEEQQGAGANQGVPDTGAPKTEADDTGLTREVMIDQMLEDVANDTGMSEEGRRRMEEALLNARDGRTPGEALDAP